MKKYFSFLVFIILVFAQVNAQLWKPQMPYVPTIRQNSHDKIDALQLKLLNGNISSDYIISNNDEINKYATYILKDKIDYLQYFIETNAAIADKEKFKWLRGLFDVLYQYNNEAKFNGFNKVNFISLINAFDKAMSLELNGASIKQVIEENEIEVSNIIISNFALQNNVGIEDCKIILLTNLCKQNPNNTLKIIAQYPTLPFADSLIVDFAHRNPEELYNYASANNELGKKIKSIDEPWVKLIVTISNSNNGRFLFPFLDAIYNNKISASDILNSIENNEAYYKLLVKVLNIYELEKQAGKKPITMDALVDKLKAKSVEDFITPINALHDEKDLKIRFAKIQNLSPNELYYLTIMGEEEMYTSSFISGVYPKIIADLGKIKTDSLFKMAHYAFYRKFIKMCANFNMLEDFLSKMDKPVAEELMKSFCSNLEDNYSLEEAVDVADSYSSIKDFFIKKIISNEVDKNITQQKNINNKKGIVIYGLLKQIFNSFDSSKNELNETAYKIPSISTISNKALKDDKDKIYVQQLFYGDKDGKNIFNNFLSNFRSNGWRITDKTYWVEVVSNGTTPVIIFANKPLNEEEGKDDEAQQKLNRYLDSLNILPTIVIHRGHSYYLKTTIKQITSYAQLVLLGSCGGYHSLAKVLAISPFAQIIASKQIGTGAINARLIELIFENLKQGKDLNWVTTWKTLEQKFNNDKELKERFDDYIPPHKNLGALFIMSYYKAME